MITLAKFFKAVKTLQPQGRSVLGLIINKKPAAVKYPGIALVKIVIKESSDWPAIERKIEKAFEAKKWIALEIEDNLPPELFNQLKSLAVQNRWQAASGELLRQPPATRIIFEVKSETLKKIETIYPNFRMLFGLIITI